MAAPVPTPRQNSAGKRLGNGHQTLITFALDPDIEFWEQSITPPGIIGGDPNDLSSQQSKRWKTKAPKRLLDLTDVTVDAFYDPVLYDSILALINVPTTVTITFPNLDQLAFFGYLREFKPGPLADEQVPKASLTVTSTNVDPVSCQEEDPVYVAGPGTSAYC